LDELIAAHHFSGAGNGAGVGAGVGAEMLQVDELSFHTHADAFGAAAHVALDAKQVHGGVGQEQAVE
jgi:hypothetical protein